MFKKYNSFKESEGKTKTKTTTKINKVGEKVT